MNSHRDRLPHDVQVRRISWVVGFVGWLVANSGSSCRGCGQPTPINAASMRRRF